jgi:HAD superfamily hydrolase (TIGR01549 family)
VFDSVLLDVDGTLVDSNYQHALAWYRAFRAHGHVLPVWAIHRKIGMGGDQLVPSLIGQEADHERGDAIRSAWQQRFETMIEEIAPVPGAADVLQRLAQSPARVCLASSGKSEHLQHYLDLLEARELLDAWTTSEDVEKSKPEPDILAVARDRIGGRRPVVVGDSTWDFEAAGRLGLEGWALRTGGFSTEELRGAGASEVYDDLYSLGQDLLPLLGAR